MVIIFCIVSDSVLVIEIISAYLILYHFGVL